MVSATTEAGPQIFVRTKSFVRQFSSASFVDTLAEAVVFDLDAYCTSNIEVTENMVLSNIDVSVRSIPVTKYPIPTTGAKESTVKERSAVDRVQPVGPDYKVYRPVAPCLTCKDFRCIYRVTPATACPATW